MNVTDSPHLRLLKIRGCGLPPRRNKGRRIATPSARNDTVGEIGCVAGNEPERSQCEKQRGRSWCRGQKLQALQAVATFGYRKREVGQENRLKSEIKSSAKQIPLKETKSNKNKAPRVARSALRNTYIISRFCSTPNCVRTRVGRMAGLVKRGKGAVGMKKPFSSG